MFGDDPDPLVMTARVGFGTASDTGEGAMHCAKRDFGLSKRENEEQGWSRNGHESKGKRGNYERMHVLKTMTATSADAMQMKT